MASGDTLSEIAARFDIPTSWLRDRNNLKSDRLQIGQVLLIPHAAGNSNYLDQAASTIEEPTYYNVQPGDSLWTIARKFNTSIKRLRETNKLSSNILQVNDRLVVGSKAVDPSSLNMSANFLTRSGAATHSRLLPVGSILLLPILPAGTKLAAPHYSSRGRS